MSAGAYIAGGPTPWDLVRRLRRKSACSPYPRGWSRHVRHQRRRLRGPGAARPGENDARQLGTVGDGLLDRIGCLVISVSYRRPYVSSELRAALASCRARRTRLVP
jgi:hypothetical protein